MPNIKTIDYEGRKELDPQCAELVDTFYACRCESCGHEWAEDNEPESCPNCNEDNRDAFSFREERVYL